MNDDAVWPIPQVFHSGDKQPNVDKRCMLHGLSTEGGSKQSRGWRAK
jgi:hypothetical protein